MAQRHRQGSGETGGEVMGGKGEVQHGDQTEQGGMDVGHENNERHRINRCKPIKRRWLISSS